MFRYLRETMCHHDITTTLFIHCYDVTVKPYITMTTLQNTAVIVKPWQHHPCYYTCTTSLWDHHEIIENMCNFNHVLTRVRFFRNSACHWGREGREVMIAKGMQAKYPDPCIILHPHCRTYRRSSSASEWTAFSSFYMNPVLHWHSGCDGHWTRTLVNTCTVHERVHGALWYGIHASVASIYDN